MSARPFRRPTPGEWLGDEPYPWPAAEDLAEGARVIACYCIESKQLGHTKDGAPYLRLQLCDRHGAIEGRVWDGAAEVDGAVEAGAFVGVRGRIQSFRGQRQLKIDEVAALAVDPAELDLFLPTTPHDLAVLEAELDRILEGFADPALRSLLDRLLGPGAGTGAAFRRAPAAKRNHHAYVGGLIEHTLSVTRACDRLARHYGDAVDRELLLAGALVHDIGKIREIDSAGGFPYTDEGKLLGHIVLGIEMVRAAARDVPELEEDRLLLLLHLVASHQGKYEWHSPKTPMILEAIILHAVDDLDAKLYQARALVEGVERGWTRYDPGFGRDFLRHRAAAPADVTPADVTPADETPERAHAESGPVAPAAAALPAAPRRGSDLDPPGATIDLFHD